MQIYRSHWSSCMLHHPNDRTEDELQKSQVQLQNSLSDQCSNTTSDLPTVATSMLHLAASICTYVEVIFSFWLLCLLPSFSALLRYVSASPQCHGMHVEIREQISGLSSLLPQCVTLTIHLCVILYLLVSPDISVFMNLEILVPKKAIVQQGIKIMTRINWELRLFLDESGLSQSAPTRKKETFLCCHSD